MEKSMKYIIYTLGCKVNQYETQAIETLLNEHGHTAASEGESADAVIVNTCAVIVAALFCDDVGNAFKLTRLVDKLDAKLCGASRSEQTSVDNS